MWIDLLQDVAICVLGAAVIVNSRTLRRVAADGCTNSDSISTNSSSIADLAAATVNNSRAIERMTRRVS